MNSCTTPPGSRKRVEFPATTLTGTLGAGNYHEYAEAAHVLR
jgi:hypothetical protein